MTNCWVRRIRLWRRKEKRLWWKMKLKPNKLKLLKMVMNMIKRLVVMKEWKMSMLTNPRNNTVTEAEESSEETSEEASGQDSSQE